MLRHEAVMVQLSPRRWAVVCEPCGYDSDADFDRRYPERVAKVACRAHDYHATRMDRGARRR